MFQQGFVDVCRISVKATTRLHDYGCGQFRVRLRIIKDLIIEQHQFLGFFDGAEQDGHCGAGMVIKFQLDLGFRLGMEVGKGTNTKVELLAI